MAADPAWSREETDYLLDLVEALDTRWLVIADRYAYPSAGGSQQQPRSVEDIKARYYSVARQLLIGREGGLEAIANNPLVKHPYSGQHERERKRGLELLMARTSEEDAEEDAVLAEAMKIEAKRKAEMGGGGGGGRRGGGGGGGNLGGAGGGGGGSAPPPMIEVTEFEAVPTVGTPPLFDVQGQPALPSPISLEGGSEGPIPRVIARSAHTRELIDTIFNGVQPEKAQKMLQASMAELKLADLPRAASRQVCGSYLALIKEVMEHLDLKKQLAARQVMIGAKRAAREEAGEDGEPFSSQVKRQRVSKRPYGE